MSRRESERFRTWRQAKGFSVGGSVQPTLRDFLFRLDLTLYLLPSELGAAFLRPVFPVVLGRSQDLASVVSVEEVEVESAPTAYFSGTLLPFSWRARTGFGTTVLMPRFITPPPERQASFGQYIVLPADRLVFAGRTGVSGSKRLLQTDASETWPIDPTSEERDGGKRGLVWHAFVDS
jgi:CRISPR-associated protein Cas5t